MRIARRSASIVIAGLFVATLIPTVAYATQPGAGCQTVAYNVEANLGGANEGKHKGIKSNVWFGNGNDDCNRVSSIAALKSNGVVEYGWVLGYSNCDGQYYTQPRTFTLWKPTNGASNCNVLGPGPSGDWVNLAISDENENDAWVAERDGSYVTGMIVDFHKATIVINGERDCTCDTAKAEFKDLKKQTAGDSGWSDWQDPNHYFDNDPDFHSHIISDTRIEVVHD